jgi:hypothetical protein
VEPRAGGTPARAAPVRRIPSPRQDVNLMRQARSGSSHLPLWDGHDACSVRQSYPSSGDVQRDRGLRQKYKLHFSHLPVVAGGDAKFSIFMGVAISVALGRTNLCEAGQSVDRFRRAAFGAAKAGKLQGSSPGLPLELIYGRSRVWKNRGRARRADAAGDPFLMVDRDLVAVGRTSRIPGSREPPGPQPNGGRDHHQLDGRPRGSGFPRGRARDRISS